MIILMTARGGRLPLFLVFFGFIITLLIIPINSYAQSSGTLSISFSNSGSIKGASDGVRMLEYSNYKLIDILDKVYDGYFYEVDSDSLRVRGFDFRWEGSLSDRKGLIEDINYMLALNLGVKVEMVKDSPDVYSLSYNGKSGCNNNTGSSIMKLNRMWKGRCVSLSQVAEQMEQWYDIKTEVHDDIVLPQIELHHDDLKIFLLYLKKSNIHIEVKKTSKVKFIYR